MMALSGLANHCPTLHRSNGCIAQAPLAGGTMRFSTLQTIIKENETRHIADSVAAHAEPWLLLDAKPDAYELDSSLARPEYLGWIHQPGFNTESSEVTLRRALLNPGRLSVLACSLQDVDRSAISVLKEEAAGLFLVLKDYESPGLQILEGMIGRAPFCFGAQILRAQIADCRDFCVGGTDYSLACALLFISMPYGGRAPL
jgi:hypothetical protein